MTGGQQAHRPRKKEEKKNVSTVHRPVWPSPVTNEAEDPQTHTPGEGKRKKGREIVDGSKNSGGSDLRRNVNLLNMISECKTTQYNTNGIEANKSK